MSVIVEVPYDCFFDTDGSPLDGGYIYIGTQGLNPETNPVAVYWDSGLTLPAAQPIRTVSGFPAKGNAPGRLYTSSSYSITVRDKAKNLVSYSAMAGDYLDRYCYQASSIADLRLVDKTVSNRVFVSGYYSAGDGGGGDYWLDLSDTTSNDNGGTIIVAADGGRWKLINNGFITPSQSGAVGDGVTDDTVAIKRLESIHVDVFLPEGRTYCIKDSYFSPYAGTKVYGSGAIKQIQGTFDPKPANPSSPYPASSYPVLKLSNQGVSVDGIAIYPLIGEAVAVTGDGCSITNCLIDGEGNTWYDAINVYAGNCYIGFNRIKNCGHWYSGTTYSLRGDAVFLSGLGGFYNCRVVGNYMCGNGRNGVLVIGHKRGLISNNVIHANRGSSVQFAFLNMPNNVSEFIVDGNVGYFNGADGFDCNNNSGASYPVVNSIISNNVFLENGWLYPTAAEQISRTGTKTETTDGGSATIINVDGIKYIGNKLKNNNRSVAYILASRNISIENNTAEKNSSYSGDDTDGIRIQSSTYVKIKGNDISVPGLSLYINGTLTGSYIIGNEFYSSNNGTSCIATSSGSFVEEFSGNSCRVSTGTFILNPLINLKNCKFIADTSGSMAVNAVSNYRVEGCSFVIGSGNVSFSSCPGLRLYNNDFNANTSSALGAVAIVSTSGNVAINSTRIYQSGSTAGLLFANAASTGNVYLRDFVVRGNPAGNSIRVNAEVTSSLNIFYDNYYSESGTTEWGSSTKKAAQYA